MVTDTTRKSKDMTVARRLLTVVISDFVCWFPIGVLGLLSSAGYPISGEVNTAVAIFVLPLNSALNPFLYTFNTLVEMRRKAYEQRLMKLMEEQIRSQANSRSEGAADSRDQQRFSLTTDDAILFVCESLKSRRETLQSINTALLVHDAHLTLTAVQQTSESTGD